MRVKRIYRDDLTKRSRVLRRNQTDSEKLLWQHLRNRRLNGIKFQRQFALGSYIVDIIARESKVIIELDGAHHSKSKQKKYDADRTEFLEEQGYVVIRFLDNDILNNTDGALESILEAINSRSEFSS